MGYIKDNNFTVGQSGTFCRGMGCEDHMFTVHCLKWLYTIRESKKQPNVSGIPRCIKSFWHFRQDDTFQPSMRQGHWRVSMAHGLNSTL